VYATVFDKPTKKAKLDEISTKPPAGITRESAASKLEALGAELFELQDLLFAAKTHSVLVVLQGRDAAGKDGVIKAVVGALNPRGVSVVSFGVPTEEERGHDFLWRVHRHTPRKGEFAIFNRSHYEDVLVVRVHGLVPEKLWKERYDHINDFEELLFEHDTLVIKFFLHISAEEQKERLLARERDPVKSWKVNINDWEERDRWAEFSEAYEVAIGRTACEAAPWLVVPADTKWFRNLAVAEAIAAALRPLRKKWEGVLEERSKEARVKMEAYRRGVEGRANRSGSNGRG